MRCPLIIVAVICASACSRVETEQQLANRVLAPVAEVCDQADATERACIVAMREAVSELRNVRGPHQAQAAIAANKLEAILE